MDLAQRVIHIDNTAEFMTKTRQIRTVPMNEWVHQFLLQRIPREEYVFTFPDGHKLNVHYVAKKFKFFVREAGVSEKLHFHSLRHTGATWLVQDGVSIYAVQRLLGHSNIQVTMGYSHWRRARCTVRSTRLWCPPNTGCARPAPSRGTS